MSFFKAVGLVQAGNRAGKSLLTRQLKNKTAVNSVRFGSHGAGKFEEEGIKYSLLGAGLIGAVIGLMVAK